MTIQEMILQVCRLAIEPDYLGRRQLRARQSGLATAVQGHDTAFLYGRLVEAFSYQGIADARAAAYMDAHGRIAFADVASGLAAPPSCAKLSGHWHFRGCGYAKAARSCAEPELLAGCPLPRHDLRNGRLNQMAYALFLFVRDMCGGDLVGWIDEQLAEADRPGEADRAVRLREALLAPLCEVYGASRKVLAMSLAELLLAADLGRERWVAAGAGMVAVDTLVHNWLHRTGIARVLGAEHAYGPLCYGAGGCAAVLELCAAEMDARVYCPDGPAHFPRLVQHAAWRFCAAGGLDVCNGNRIDDRVGCLQLDCPVSAGCAHLRPT